jgi:hypothetical protein
LLINFGAPTLKKGLHRIVNNLHPSTSPREPILPPMNHAARNARGGAEDGERAEDPLRSRIIHYQTEDGRVRIQCRFKHETLWLTQARVSPMLP